jgi:alpha-D-xyloside xylohydrolase
MKRREFLSLGLSAAALAHTQRTLPTQPLTPAAVHPGVWKFTYGTPEAITPVRTRYYRPATAGLAALPRVDACPVNVSARTSRRGTLVTLPLQPHELVYGLGLQMQSFIQRGLKKTLRVNADPAIDSGDSHAPVPFYVTTRGYGVLIDTARYATFYCGNKPRKIARAADAPGERSPEVTADPLPAAYRRFRFGEPSEVMIEVPRVEGVDVYVFGGPTLRLATQRYNLFAGGGALPPRWGLGVWYRVERDFSQQDVLALAADFRSRKIPCDVLGLEPGWQTHAYSCSYKWSDRFPSPGDMIQALGRDHFRVNLWEHAFTHPSSAIYDPLFPHSADYEVWDGIVPDFLTTDARRIFSEYHAREHVAIGVAGYKLDECDNSDFTRNWSFPEVSRFPSGADGEQMHSLFGLRYQDTIQGIFDQRKQRTYGLVRSSQALAAPYPYVLYSDLYDHATFVRSIAHASFSGLLWTPEVRDASSDEDLIRRVQAVVFSPMALINAWYIKNPPWKQIDREANNKGELADNWERLEQTCRSALELRMRFLPLIHAAFVRYHREGLPPFRALVMDYPDDPQTWAIDDQYVVGNDVIVAPVTAGHAQRSVYLPAGDWFDFWSGARHAGGRSITIDVPLEQVPLFARAGALLPLADVTTHTDDPAAWVVTVLVCGDGSVATSIFEDDEGVPAGLTEVHLTWDASTGRGTVERSREHPGRRYDVSAWRPLAMRG